MPGTETISLMVTIFRTVGLNTEKQTNVKI